MRSAYFSYEQLGITESDFKQKALTWADTFPVAAYYENNQISYPYGGFENFLAVTSVTSPLINPDNAFTGLSRVIADANEILCGFLNYDLKNQIENLQSLQPDFLGFPLIYFFKPQLVFVFQAEGVTLRCSHADPKQILETIFSIELPPPFQYHSIEIQQRTSKAQYLETVEKIRQNILEGDVYEINYCIEFFSPAAIINPVDTFLNLNRVSPMPFAGFFKLQDKYLLCASPERSLKKEGTKLISQPIKGTIQRSPDRIQDQLLREHLRTNEKEISENMMIMDLVRNDLAKSSETGSVKVEEMFGIYGFQHLYQMITTITSTVRPDINMVEVIKNAFPMGSMTGAPKIKAMELIENYETTRRGLFSGSLGYIKPNGDFDFNVVIRSLQYNATSKYLSYMVGSAITYDSNPEQEYEECLLKAKGIIDILQNK